MKKELTISLLITIFVLVGAFLMIAKSTTPSVSTETTSTPTQMTTSSTSTNIVTSIDVQKHNSISDCWIVLNNNVYNVTSYIDQHPGGLTMVPFCGKDATEAYNTIREGSGHSNKATKLLQSFYVGTTQ